MILQLLLKLGEMLDRDFRFNLEMAETIGLGGAVLLEYLKSSGTKNSKIEDLLSTLSFWDENELMGVLIDLNVRGLIDLDTNKKMVSLAGAGKKNKINDSKKNTKNQHTKELGTFGRCLGNFS